METENCNARGMQLNNSTCLVANIYYALSPFIFFFLTFPSIRKVLF